MADTERANAVRLPSKLNPAPLIPEVYYTNDRTMPCRKRMGSFLKCYVKIGTVTGACAAVGINRRMFYQWLKKDEKFKAAFDRLELDVADRVEHALLKTAEAGNVAAQIFYLCNRFPERWQHVQNIRISGGLTHSIEPPTPEEAARQIEEEYRRRNPELSLPLLEEAKQ